MDVREIVSEGIALKDIPKDNGLIILNAVDFIEAFKPVTKWQRASGFDEPMLNSVTIVPESKKMIRLIAYDMVTRIVCDVPADLVSVKHAMSVDIRSLNSLLILADETIAFVTDGSSVAVSVPGGWAYLPSYDIVPEKVLKNAILPKFSNEKARRVVADSLLDSVGQLKKLAATAPAGEMRLLFGEEERIFACDGNVVASSSCYFIPTAVTVSDAEVIHAVVSASDPSEKVTLLELEKDKFAVTTERFSFEFSKKGVKLSKKVVQLVEGGTKNFFYVDSDMALKVVRAISSVKDASGQVTLVVKEGVTGFVLEARFIDSLGNNTKLVVSTKSKGVKAEIKVTTDVDYLKAILGMCSTDALSKLEVSARGISVESDTVFAVIISGNVG